MAVFLAEVSCKDSFEGGERSGCSDFIGKVFPGLKESWAECESVLWEEADRRILEPGGAKVVGWLYVGRLLVQPGKRRCVKVTGIKSRRQEARKLCNRRTGVVVE